MRIRTHILIFQAFVVFSVATLAFVAYANVSSARYTLERVRWANQELHAMTQLAVYANRYSEQIAEVLLIGEPELPDFESARGDVKRSFDRLRRLITEEIAFTSDPAEKEQEAQELVRLDQMQALFAEVDSTAERVLVLSAAGRQAEAVALFRSDIENRLDADFERMIAEAVAGERDESVRAEAQAEARSVRLMAVTVAVSGWLMILTLGAGYSFARALTRPIAALAEGAVAVGRGDLNHRITVAGTNEFAQLSQRFNQMAADLSRQRDALLSARNDLELQVAQRTEQLAASNHRLTQIDYRRSRFLADASHELRTPLTVLRGEAEVALRGPPKPDTVYRDALRRVVEQAVDMNRLVDDLLFLARSEANDVHFEVRTTAIGSIVDDAVRQATVLGGTRNISVALHRNEPGMSVLADAQRLRQALVIVLDNAVRYSDEGGSVHVEVNATDSGGPSVEIVVRDLGPGISEEEMPHIFRRFFRGDAARTRSPSGSGLGLAIARWIIQKHNGEIWPSTPPEGGASMHVRLPIVREA